MAGASLDFLLLGRGIHLSVKVISKSSNLLVRSQVLFIQVQVRSINKTLSGQSYIKISQHVGVVISIGLSLRMFCINMKTKKNQEISLI